jgi:hypothetical protein
LSSSINHGVCLHVLPPLLEPCRFDNVVRIVAPPPDTKRTTVELDDKKPQQA